MELDTLLFTDLSHLNSRVVRHDFAQLLLGLVISLCLEYCECLWPLRRESQWPCVECTIDRTHPRSRWICFGFKLHGN